MKYERLLQRRKTICYNISFYSKKALELDGNSSRSEAVNRSTTLEKAYKEFLKILKDMEAADEHDPEVLLEGNLKPKKNILKPSHFYRR